jgi:hypothetical protein
MEEEKRSRLIPSAVKSASGDSRIVWTASIRSGVTKRVRQLQRQFRIIGRSVPRRPFGRIARGEDVREKLNAFANREGFGCDVLVRPQSWDPSLRSRTRRRSMNRSVKLQNWTAQQQGRQATSAPIFDFNAEAVARVPDRQTHRGPQSGR